MSTYKRPFVRQEPQRQRQRLSRILTALYKAKGESFTSVGATAIETAIVLTKREKDRLLPPVPDEGA